MYGSTLIVWTILSSHLSQRVICCVYLYVSVVPTTWASATLVVEPGYESVEDWFSSAWHWYSSACHWYIHVCCLCVYTCTCTYETNCGSFLICIHTVWFLLVYAAMHVHRYIDFWCLIFKGSSFWASWNMSFWKYFRCSCCKMIWLRLLKVFTSNLFTFFQCY